MITSDSISVSRVHAVGGNGAGLAQPGTSITPSPRPSANGAAGGGGGGLGRASSSGLAGGRPTSAPSSEWRSVGDKAVKGALTGEGVRLRGRVRGKEPARPLRLVSATLRQLLFAAHKRVTILNCVTIHGRIRVPWRCVAGHAACRCRVLAVSNPSRRPAVGRQRLRVGLGGAAPELQPARVVHAHRQEL
jgi:hypothetical protein